MADNALPPLPTAPTPLPDSEVERLRQWKYRFAQSIVFGVPVVALSWVGPSLGGPEAGRWVGLFETILVGWVMYVGALGLIGDALIRQKWTVDLAVGALACAAYAWNVIQLVMAVARGKTLGSSRGFLMATVIIIGWAGGGWLLMSMARERAARVHSE